MFWKLIPDQGRTDGRGVGRILQTQRRRRHQGPGPGQAPSCFSPGGHPNPSPPPPAPLSAAFRVLFPPLTQPGEGRAAGSEAQPGTASRNWWAESRRAEGRQGQTASGLEGPPQAELSQKARL